MCKLIKQLHLLLSDVIFVLCLYIRKLKSFMLQILYCILSSEKSLKSSRLIMINTICLYFMSLYICYIAIWYNAVLSRHLHCINSICIATISIITMYPGNMKLIKCRQIISDYRRH